MTASKTICPASPDGKHTWVRGQCIDCDALKPRDERSDEERWQLGYDEIRAGVVAERLAGYAAR